MTSTYQNARSNGTGRCFRCGKDGIWENDLFLGLGGDICPGWVPICESCDDGDGSLRFHGRTIVELRDVTAFGSAEFDCAPVQLEVFSMYNGGWQDDR